MKPKYALIVVLLILLLAACSSKDSSDCPLPSTGFSESDLIGTWGGYVETAWDSTLIIREDNRYKQIINIKRTGFQYESDWLPWQITYSEQGLPYLHLEGLLMCAYWQQMDCTGKTNIEPVNPGDTKDIYADATYWYDYCQDIWVETPGKGVFMVLEGPKRLPRGIVLVPFTKSPDGVTGPTYELREP